MMFPTARLTRPVEVFALLLLVVFTTELAVMELFSPLFLQVGVVIAALIDATLLVVIAAVPLSIIFAPVFRGRLRRDDAVRRALVAAFGKLALGCLAIELLVMLLLPGLLPPDNSTLFDLANAGLTTLGSAPLLWWLLARLDRDNYRIVLADLLESPQLLYLLLIYIIFVSALLQELLFSDDLPMVYHSPAHIVEALMMTLIIAPFLWLFVARPLRRSVQAERVRARAVYEQVIDAVVLVDGQGRIVSLNPAARSIFGYAEAELVGRLVDVLCADERQALELLRLAATDDRGAHGVFREINGQRRNGTLLTMDVSVSRILIGGREDHLLIMRDVTERKEAERALRESDIRFREVYEQSEDAILFFKPGSFYVIDANATSEQLFGYAKADLRGHGLERLFSGQHLARVQQLVAAIRSGEKLQIDSLVAVRSDGSECIVTLRVKVMTLQGIEVIYSTLRDITERVLMERESREIQARLIQANKMTSLGLLVSGVAHEVNNPNSFIMNNAQLFAASWRDCRKILHEYSRDNGDFLLGGIPFSEFDAQSVQLLEGILDGSRRIDRIIDSLKQFARPTVIGSMGEVDLNQVVASAVAILQHELVRYTEHFRCDLAGELPRIKGNGQQLGQVIINLLMNACQALPDRSCSIRLATAYDPTIDMVAVLVQDEGLGIDPENSRQIMEPFFTTKLDSGGTGLGLSICRTIVAEHWGELQFVSAPGEGTTFTVKLPVGDLPRKGHRIDEGL